MAVLTPDFQSMPEEYQRILFDWYRTHTQLLSLRYSYWSAAGQVRLSIWSAFLITNPDGSSIAFQAGPQGQISKV